MSSIDFKMLVEAIQNVHNTFQEQASKTVNICLTVRNWLIGFYIVEFEQNGNDRAGYGTSLLARIAQEIAIKGLTAPELSRCRQFYKVYPEILGSRTQTFIQGIDNNALPMLSNQILGLTTQKLDRSDNHLPSEAELETFVEKELKAGGVVG